MSTQQRSFVFGHDWAGIENVAWQFVVFRKLNNCLPAKVHS
jgi:hypothetical protein